MTDKNTHVLTFASLGAFIDDAEKRLSADKGACWGGASIDRAPTDRGTESLEAALKLARDGWPEGTERLLSGIEHAAAPQQVTVCHPAISWDVAGMVPDVAAFCAGEPEHMMTFEDHDSAALPVVRIVCPGAYSHNIKAETVDRYGVALLSHIRALQTAGKSVELYWAHAVSHYKANRRRGERAALTLVRLSDPMVPIDTDVLAFALMHRAMLRRLGFAVEEQRPELSYLQRAYGLALTLNSSQARPHMPDNAVLLPGINDFVGYSQQQTTDRIGQLLATGGL